MSATHPLMEPAIRPFTQPTFKDLQLALMAMTLRVKKAEDELSMLCRFPFQVEVRTRDADNDGPAEYDYISAPDELVIEAVDALIDKYIDELESDVKRRMKDSEEAP